MSKTQHPVACAVLSAFGFARLQSAEDSGQYNYNEATT